MNICIYLLRSRQYAYIHDPILNAFLEKSKYDNQDYLNNEMKNAINTIIESKEIMEYNHINFQVRTGFNIGIASSYYFTNSVFTENGELVSQESGNHTYGF